jgi:hypothetical protein
MSADTKEVPAAIRGDAAIPNRREIVSASRGPKAISVATTRDNENALAFRVFAG